MLVIFLDIDGVMNNYASPLSPHHESLAFSEESVILIHDLLQKTGAKIVISSTWRIGETIQSLNEEVLVHYQLDKYVVGFTPILDEETRGTEIHHYLMKHPEIDRFVILDDDQDMDPYLSNLIRTRTSKGFTKKEYHEALSLFNRPKEGV